VTTSEEARALRNQALADTDRYLLPDYPITQFGLWRLKDYRQKLRDWPESDGFPDTETMPKQDDWSEYKIQLVIDQTVEE